MSTKFVESGDRIHLNPSQAYTAGNVYIIDGVPGVAIDDYTSSDDLAVFQTRGVFELALNASDAATQGRVAYWDSGAGEVVDTPDDTDTTPIGTFHEDSTGTTANVKLAGLEGQSLVLFHDQGDDGGTLDLSGYAGPYDICLTVDTEDGAVEVEMPKAANMQGRTLTVIRAGSGTNAITLDQNGSETINGSATADADLDAEHDVKQFVANTATNWHIVSDITA